MSEIPPTMMLAWQYHHHGKPSEVLKKEERVVPTPTASQILIKVKCAALNPVGNKSMQHFPSIMVKKPCVAEMDVSGIVAGVGTGVSSFKIGDEVYGIIPGELQFKTSNGALSQYTVVEEHNLTHKPNNISWQEAAAIPLTALTAYEALVDFGEINTGPKRVFVNGGSGGVGTIGISMAKAFGAHVVASCSDKNIEFVKQRGADEVIDYNAEDLPTQLKHKYNAEKFDIIFDTVGSKHLFHHCESYLQETGIFIQVGAPMGGFGDIMKMGASVATNALLPGFLGGVRRKYKFFMMKPTKQHLEAVNQFVTEGKLRPAIDSEYSFDDVLKAYERIMSNRARGKVVVNIS
eukprot:Phypoly_transcript_12430.p1 GENE.Phypoly_transcript_12430~~Phypoly_transcript_12430.p1  ORF type:complete len:348 (+),score=54.56 Phypoly_transcript_12430:64-1107(+)